MTGYVTGGVNDFSQVAVTFQSRDFAAPEK